MTLSLRTLLVTVGLVAFATAALTAGGVPATLFQAFIGSCILVATITAVVGVRRPRAIASGFAISGGLYLLLLFVAGEKELNPHTGSLPSTVVASYGYDALYQPIYKDMTTGKVVPNYQPTSGGFGGGAMPTVVMIEEFPNRHTYMKTAHACALILVGAAGAFYAGGLYARQHRDQHSG